MTRTKRKQVFRKGKPPDDPGPGQGRSTPALKTMTTAPSWGEGRRHRELEKKSGWQEITGSADRETGKTLPVKEGPDNRRM